VQLNPTTRGLLILNVDSRPRPPYLQIQLHIMEVRAANDLARAFERATKARANALTMTADPTGLFVANQKQIVELAAKKRLPAIYTSSNVCKRWWPDVLCTE
jgi:hypothetical protein